MGKTFAQVIQDDKDEFKRLFGLSANEFMDSFLTVATRKFSVNVIKLDEWFEANKGYEIDRDGSLSDFVKKAYGEEARKFIEEHM